MCARVFLYLAHVNVFGKEYCIALAFDGFRTNDWTRGPVTVHLLNLGMPAACICTLAWGLRGADVSPTKCLF